MKRILIEQVDNGYIVSNRPEGGGFDSIYVSDKSGIHVFETFASMSKWLEGHFEPIHATSSAPYIKHLGNDET